MRKAHAVVVSATVGVVAASEEKAAETARLVAARSIVSSAELLEQRKSSVRILSTHPQPRAAIHS